MRLMSKVALAGAAACALAGTAYAADSSLQVGSASGSAEAGQGGRGSQDRAARRRGISLRRDNDVV